MCSSARFESVREDARLSCGSCCNQGTSAGAHSDSAFPGALIQGRRCAARPFSPRFNIPSLSQRNASAEAGSPPTLGIFRKSEYRVILYAKDDPFCATALADELPIEDILAVEHDIVPFDWADVFQQGEIDSIGERVRTHSGAGRFRTPASRRCTPGSGSGSCRCSSAPTARGR